MRLKNIDLLLAAMIALMNIILVLLPGYPSVIGIVLALPLVFLLPGYTLTEALFYKRPFDGVYRCIFTLGLSLAIDILSGFILNIFPIGLWSTSWAIFLGLLTVLFSLLVAYLRRGSSIGGIRLPKFGFGIHQYILLGLSIVVAILSIEYSAIGVVQQPHPDLTQLWMLPSTQANNNCAIRLGVHSFETTSVTYQLTMAINGVQANTWSPVVLAPQEEWDRLVPIPPRYTSGIYIEVRLYKSDKPRTVYRTVHLTLNKSGGGKEEKCNIG